MKIHCPSCGRVQKPHNTREIFLSSIGEMVYMAQSEQLLNGSLHRAYPRRFALDTKVEDTAPYLWPLVSSFLGLPRLPRQTRNVA
jgi:hypothetical protein